MEYLQYATFLQLLELLAAMAGSFYLFRVKPRNKYTKYLVYFLWLTFVVEIVGIYSSYAYFSDYKKLSFLKDSVFQRNFWLYNIKGIIEFSVLAYFFRSFIKTVSWKKTLKYLALFFILSTILNLIFSGSYFMAYAAYTAIAGTILVLISVGFYFCEMLKSEAILKFKSSLTFYIAIGVLFFQIVLTPLKIYSRFFIESSNPEFVALWKPLLVIANVFMYTCFIIGFLICSQKKRSY
ncbi:hypothetical protein L1I30_12970 [Gillisia sp. M10.2A]|uniref:Uncharacterized protein n=1 Tax=Gillisia lutea TaxID=2909668 RepID=A0ABS9EIC6_9FLAO|nr:hypothetical protein [Gillisia lutea]MCF4102581.1 hypothetical protein [Gillisia lutea]